MSKRIDARGQRCPAPVMMARQAIVAGEGAFTIEVDDPTAVENLSRLAANQGYELVVRALPDGAHALDFLRQGEAAPADSIPPAVGATGAGAGTALFISRDILGSGDRELGINLMRMFFYTLAEGGEAPESILFINDGVKLPVMDEQIAAHLKTLLDRGSSVLVCGTCLNFYNLSDQLKIGTVSNMYDIVSCMQAADKVITI